MEGKAAFSGLQEPVLFPDLTLVPGTTQSLSVDALPSLERGDMAWWHWEWEGGSWPRSRGCGGGRYRFLVTASTSWTSEEHAGALSSCRNCRSHGAEAWLADLPPWQQFEAAATAKILPASDTLHNKIQRACLRGKCLIQGLGEGCGE